jgi:hypothetical protein
MQQLMTEQGAQTTCGSPPIGLRSPRPRVTYGTRLAPAARPLSRTHSLPWRRQRHVLRAGADMPGKRHRVVGTPNKTLLSQPLLGSVGWFAATAFARASNSRAVVWLPHTLDADPHSTRISTPGSALIPIEIAHKTAAVDEAVYGSIAPVTIGKCPLRGTGSPGSGQERSWMNWQPCPESGGVSLSGRQLRLLKNRRRAHG